MKTPITNLKEVIFSRKMLKDEYKELLEKAFEHCERSFENAVVNAHIDGRLVALLDKQETGEEYFNKKYNQNK